MNACADFSLQQWLQHIQSQHSRTIDMQLDRVAEVWRRLGEWGDATPVVIAVAGTNGKGSCAAMLEAAYLHANYKVACYTSPHLVNYNERFRINAACASSDSICAAFCAIETARGDTPLTYFEFSTLCALYLFRLAKVDAAILEVGMGGRLDAVNIAHNAIALITRIGIDHADWLGDDIDSIAHEKAGIIKPNALAITASPHAPPAIAAFAKKQNAQLWRAGEHFTYAHDKKLTWRCKLAFADSLDPSWRREVSVSPPLAGAHQHENIAGVLAVIAALHDKLPMRPAQAAQGVAQTALRARCEIIAREPLVIIDVAHNRDSAEQLAEFLRRHAVGGETHAVVGILRDKSPREILAPIKSQVTHWYFAGLEDARGQSGEDLRKKFARELAREGRAFASPQSAWRAAMRRAQTRDRVLVVGSFITAGAIMAHIRPAMPRCRADNTH